MGGGEGGERSEDFVASLPSTQEQAVVDISRWQWRNGLCVGASLYDVCLNYIVSLKSNKLRSFGVGVPNLCVSH